MFALIVQTLLLLAIAFILGCVLGCLLRNLFGRAEAEVPSTATKSGVAIGATAAGAASLASAKQSTPSVPSPPTPMAPVAPVEPAPLVEPKPRPEPARPAPVAAPVEKPGKPEKPKASAKPKAEPKPKAKTKPVTTPAPAVKSKPDNLKLIRGIGPQNEGRLNTLGVYQFSQIAKWTTRDTQHYGEVLAFPGRIEREDWVGQAQVLAKGGSTEFAKRVKSGDVGSSVGKAAAGEMGKKPSGTLKEARGGKPDDLTLIDGVGNAIESKMFKLGIFHFEQIAQMSREELIWLGNAVGFPGRPERENWAGESRSLASGDRTESAKPAARGVIKSRRKT